jgi:hypothetical protein
MVFSIAALYKELVDGLPGQRELMKLRREWPRDMKITYLKNEPN